MGARRRPNFGSDELFDLHLRGALDVLLRVVDRDQFEELLIWADNDEALDGFRLRTISAEVFLESESRLSVFMALKEAFAPQRRMPLPGILAGRRAIAPRCRHPHSLVCGG
jgi:hypothetical protein